MRSKSRTKGMMVPDAESSGNPPDMVIPYTKGSTTLKDRAM
jgi:hypothetical protein